MPKFKAVILSLFVILSLAGCAYLGGPLITTAAVVREPAPAVFFATPEAAITHYIAGVAAGDAAQLLQACAIEEMATNFHFDRYTARLGVLLPIQGLAPADHPLYIEMNKAQLTAQILSRVKILTYSLLSAEAIADGATLLIDEARTAQFMKDVDPQRLAALTVEQIALPNATLMASARYQENMARAAAIYSADESTERVALIAFEDETYALGFTLLRYGEGWKISDPTSPLANTNALGAAEPITVAEFERMTSDVE